MAGATIWTSDWLINLSEFHLVRLRWKDNGWWEENRKEYHKWSAAIGLNIIDPIGFHRPADPADVPENAYHTGTVESYREDDFMRMDGMHVLSARGRCSKSMI
ncbi:MAG: hypothetical protein AAGE80_04525 [Pseudomonadota bacterium]